MKDQQYWIEKLQLQPHPEGGYYKETYRSKESIASSGNVFPGGRSYSTGIYFMLSTGNFSAFHRIKSDEMWHFYAGKGINIYVIQSNGKLEVIKLGDNPDNGEVFQAIVPAGAWFASRVEEPNSYSLVGCTVAPGFDFQDFKMADRDVLVNSFPQHKELITELTR